MSEVLEQTRRPMPRPRRRRASHLEALRSALASAHASRKRDRTRARLMMATAQVLERRGWDGLRVAEIAEAAGISTAAFYGYFTDRRDAARQVLVRFVDHFYAPLEGGPRPAGELGETVMTHLATARSNAGLLRALSQAVDSAPALADLVDRRRREWVRRASPPVVGGEGGDGFKLSGAVEAMMSGAARRIALHPTSDDELAVLGGAIARLWRAALAPEAPVPPARLN